ncbi:MAG: hypothetical protein HGB10_07955 [Coriobacteriia bacterium]|nr:hypothetical protein [Coriobacteriia bacterium]
MSGALNSWVLPMATGILVGVFTVLLAMQWLARRKPHQLWWTIGFAMYASAALLEAVMQLSGGWGELTFRLYALTSASLVAVLAQGSLSLVARKPLWPRVYLAYNAVCFAAFAFGVFTTQLVAEELANPKLSSYAALGGSAMTYPRVMSMLMTIPATFVLLGAAVLSIIRFLRKKEFAYRMWANVLIAAATMVIASGGGLAKAGNTTLFYLAEMGAAVLFFAGFLLAGTLKKGADRIREGRAAERTATASGGDQ